MENQKEYSYVNLYGDEYRLYKKIIYKMDVLSWINTRDDEMVEAMLEDYSPEIRSKALEIIKNADYYLENDEIADKVKIRLSDSPLFIRTKALNICIDRKLHISEKEAINILENILAREGVDKSRTSKKFEEDLMNFAQNKD